MTILLTGRLGLLGSALNAAIPYCDAVARQFDGDLLRLDNCERIINTYSPQIVIHAAAKVGGIKLNADKPETMFYENIVMNANLVHAAAKHGVKKFITFGTTCSFSPDLASLSHANILDSTPYHGNYGYGWAKRMLYTNLQAARDEYGMEFSYVVLPSLFGPHDNFDLQDAHVIPSLLHKRLLANDELTIWGTGIAEREFAYSRDVASVIASRLEDLPEVLFLRGRRMTIKSLVETICRVTEFQGRVQWDFSKSDGQLLRPMAEEAVDCVETPLELALKQTWEWLKANRTELTLLI